MVQSLDDLWFLGQPKTITWILGTKPLDQESKDLSTILYRPKSCHTVKDHVSLYFQGLINS